MEFQASAAVVQGCATPLNADPLEPMQMGFGREEAAAINLLLWN